MFCSECAKRLPESASFCPSCGTQVVLQQRNCNVCSQPVTLTEKFCRHCGKENKFITQNNTAMRSTAKLSQPIVYNSTDRNSTQLPSESSFSNNADILSSTEPKTALRPSSASEKVCAFIVHETMSLEPIFAKFKHSLEAIYPGCILAFYKQAQSINSIRESFHTLMSAGVKISSVTILADTNLIPHFELEDLTQYDKFVLTDNPYGFLTPVELNVENVLVPQLPVSRVPCNNIKTLEKILAASKSHTLPHWKNGIAVTAEAWADITQKIINDVTSHPVQIVSSPSNIYSSILHSSFNELERIHINLHGSKDEPNWYGECEENSEYPIAVTPTHKLGKNGTVVIAECCYGAQTRYERLSGEVLTGLSSQMLVDNARWFIGSTIIAWGGVNGGEPSCADEITRLSWKYLDLSHCAVQSLYLAKESLAESALSEHTHAKLNPSLLNTLLSFVCYGFPAPHYKEVDIATNNKLDSKVITPTAKSHSKLDEIRQRMTEKDRFASEKPTSVDLIREKLADRLKNCKTKEIFSSNSLEGFINQVNLSESALKVVKSSDSTVNAKYSLIEFNANNEKIKLIKWQKNNLATGLTISSLAKIEPSGSLTNIVQARSFNWSL